MNSAQKRVKGIVGRQQTALQIPRVEGGKTKGKNWKLSGARGIAFHLLMSQGWLSAIAFSLLATVLGMTGTLPSANADELPEQPPEQPNLGLGNEQGTQETLTTRGEGDFVEQLPTSVEAPLLTSTSQSLISNPQSLIPSSSLLSADLEVTKEIPDKISVDVPSLVANTSVTQSQVGETQPDKKQERVESAQQDRPEKVEPNSPPTPSASSAPSPSTLPETVSQDNAPSTESPVTLAPGEVRILTPQTGVMSTNSTNLVVQYNADSQIQVTVNQKPLNPSTSTQQQRDEAQNIITQSWYNIPLKDGENTLTVQAGNGTPQSIQLTVKQTKAKIEISPVGNPQVPADGRSILTFQGRIIDENGQAIAEDTLITLTTSAGKFVGADQDKDQLGFQVMARGGQFTAQLQSGLEAQKVRIRAAIYRPESSNLTPSDESSESRERTPADLKELALASVIETYTQVEFITNLRPSLVSGVINLRIGQSGTDFWGPRREFLNPDLIDDGTEFDLSGAVFATGRVGEWLFTGAYNSARPLNETCEGITRLFRGPQFCEQQYPVYGDSSTVDYLTPSTDSVYLRFERTSPVLGAEPDYVMWGDYNTQEFARGSQLFTATTRQLHGFKGNYNLGNLQLTAMYSRDIEGFQRDTIAPNGTSGYYFLSRRLVIPGSENIFLETEVNNRPGTVIERKPLSRGADYEIDYDRGTILFRRPILSTEFGFLPTTTGDFSETSTLLVRRIVVTYQYDGEDDDTQLYAGRLQYNFSQAFNLESWIAATYLREDQGAQDFELYGADFRIPLGTNGQIIGEYAHSRNDSLFLGNVSGSAYRLEVNGNITPDFTARAYYRSVEENFANNATTSFTPGQTRYGGVLAYRLGSSTSLKAGYDFEENFGIAPAVRTDFFDLFNPGPEPIPGSAVNNTLQTISVGIEQKLFGDAVIGLDYVNRQREDRVGDIFDGNASQLISQLAVPITQSLAFRAQNELNLGDSDPLYPDRTTFGFDWAAYPGVTVRLAHQFYDDGIFDNDSITSLDTILEHKLWENTSITGRYSVISAFGGVTGQGAVGLNHRWVITPGLRVNLGYEHTFSNTSIVTAAGERFPQPYAVGQSAAALALLGGDVYSVGVEYSDNPNFQASARFEHRTGSGNDNTVFSIAAAGKLTPALTVLARYEQANFANQLIEGLGDSANLRFGLAYRNPNSDRWNALLRYDYRKNPYTIPETLLIGSGTGSTDHVFAGEAIFAPSWRWEFYGKGAVRYSSTDLEDNFSNSSTIFLTQLRATYKLGYRMDLAVEGRWIGQDSPSFSETGIAVETGYYLTPDLRVGVGYSFGGVDDRDFTGYRSEGGPYLSVTFKVNELLGGFGRQRVVPPQQQESRVEPVATGDKPSATSGVKTTSEE
jgi:hypothetical protein